MSFVATEHGIEQAATLLSAALAAAKTIRALRQ